MGTKDGGKKPNPNDLNSFKGFFYYMIMILVITVLLNGLVFPSALKSQVKEVGYNEFLAMVDNNQVTQVEKDDTNGEYMFIAKDSNGKEQVYKTGLWDDPDLTDRLYSKGVTFDKVIPRKESCDHEYFRELDPSVHDHDRDRTALKPQHGEAHGRKRDDIWKVQCKDLRGERDRRDIRGCRR